MPLQRFTALPVGPRRIAGQAGPGTLLRFAALSVRRSVQRFEAILAWPLPLFAGNILSRCRRFHQVSGSSGSIGRRAIRFSVLSAIPHPVTWTRIKLASPVRLVSRRDCDPSGSLRRQSDPDASHEVLFPSAFTSHAALSGAVRCRWNGLEPGQPPDCPTSTFWPVEQLTKLN